MSESERKGPPRFLFLEFLDSEINGLLTGLRREFSFGDFDHQIHLTVRGPYPGSIPANDVERNQDVLDEDPLLIHGAGIFCNHETYIVYIKVSSPALKKIWWKPDFPIEKYGFNPHITLYKGYDEVLANIIYNFLDSEQIKLVCHQARLTPFASKQKELFPYGDIPNERHFLNLSNKRMVRADILQRASNIVSEYQKSQKYKKLL